MTEFPVINPIAIGARIRELRIARHFTVEQIRDYLGLESTQAIYKWQRGDSLPTIDNLYALSVLFGTTVDYILRGYEEEEREPSSFCFIEPLVYLFLQRDMP